jgi:hypothetical protein
VLVVTKKGLRGMWGNGLRATYKQSWGVYIIDDMGSSKHLTIRMHHMGLGEHMGLHSLNYSKLQPVPEEKRTQPPRGNVRSI